MTTTSDLHKVSILDLTMPQVEAIEEACGVAVSEWKNPPSQGKLFRYVLAAGNGIEPDDPRLMSLTMRQFLDLVSLDDEEVNPTETAQPST